MRARIRIRRFDPDRPELPAWSEHEVDVKETDRLLDALHLIRDGQDGSLGFRRSCGMGICGSDAMLVNGRNRLACKVLFTELGPDVTVEPLKGYQPVKDLVVDMDPFFAQLRSIKPWLINDEPPPERERLQSPEQRERYDDTTKCILCAACTTSCPPFWHDPTFVGPAAIVNAHRFIYDSRDEGETERLERLSGEEGVFRCRTAFNCTQACPRGIRVTDAIQQIKRLILKRTV